MDARISELLRPHQRDSSAHLARILRAGNSAVDLSGGGTGKTYSAIAVAADLNLPTLAVLPKISITGWNRVAQYLGSEVSTINYEQVRTGHTPFGSWDNNPPRGYTAERFFKCVSCQREVWFDARYFPCYCHPAGLHCVEEKRKPWKYGRFNWNPAVRFLIFDEAQRCSGLDSLNADMMIAARRQGIPTLALSATAACSPLQLRALGYLIDLHKLTNFESFARRHGCVRDGAFRGLRWNLGAARQREVMAQLRDEIIPEHGVRIRTEDIPGFPTCQITAELYDLEASGRIDALYAEMADALKVLEERKAHDLSVDHPLTIILRARQEIELLKVPIAVELAQDYVAKGFSVALFVNFKQTLDELCRRLHTSCIIDGSPEGTRNRQRNIDAFQSDEQRVVVANLKAGGVSVSLHDLHGEHPRVGLAFPDFSADAMKQMFYRLPREGAKTPSLYRVLFAAKTVEVKVHRAMSRKLDNIDALNDADLNPCNLQLDELPPAGN